MTYFPSKHTPQNRTTSKVPQKDLDVLQMLTLLHLSHWLEWEHPVLCRYTTCPHCNQKAGLIITDADPLTHEPTLMHRLRFVSLTDPPQSGGRRGGEGWWWWWWWWELQWWELMNMIIYPPPPPALWSLLTEDIGQQLCSLHHSVSLLSSSVTYVQTQRTEFHSLKWNDVAFRRDAVTTMSPPAPIFQKTIT